jgi:hypothetical protein
MASCQPGNGVCSPLIVSLDEQLRPRAGNELAHRFSRYLPVNDALTVSKAVKVGLVLGVVKAGSKERSHVHDTASFPEDRDL